MLNKAIQPYESHIPYLLQFLVRSFFLFFYYNGDMKFEFRTVWCVFFMFVSLLFFSSCNLLF